MSDIFPAGAKIDVTADTYEAAAAAALQWNLETTQLERGRYHFCIQAVHVTDAATTWGFTHLGRFAGTYKNFFGELPSEQKNGDPSFREGIRSRTTNHRLKLVGV